MYMVMHPEARLSEAERDRLLAGFAATPGCSGGEGFGGEDEGAEDRPHADRLR